MFNFFLFLSSLIGVLKQVLRGDTALGIAFLEKIPSCSARVDSRHDKRHYALNIEED